ncbi:MAG: 23S rRNA (guanosine(2251)-2'-O)-methyltransferase RlmB [Alphaproteobacteria bacterium]|nr:23S rRNA (guanosine(2251)-2'-O)-methyltransferase RlmB [Alphaproteobacteria bacterium]
MRLPGDARPRRTAAAKTGAAKERLKDFTKPARGEKFKPRFNAEAKPRRFEKDKTKPFRRDDTKPGKPAFRAKTGKPKPEAAPQEQYRPTHEGAVLIWGLHAARAAWMNPDRRVHRAWLTESGEKSFEASQNEAREELLKRPDAKRLDRDAIDRIAPPGSVHQGIVIEVAPLPEPTLRDIIGADQPTDLILMLDQVTDPHNVGAILRSAAAFGAGAIIMTERNAPITTGVMAKSASGALEHTPIVHVVNLARTLDELREAGYWCVGLAEQGEKSLAEMDLSGRTVLVLGNEGEGLRHLTRQKCDELARLPTGGPIASLNVSNAAAVALYEAAKQKNRFA